MLTPRRGVQLTGTLDSNTSSFVLDCRERRPVSYIAEYMHAPARAHVQRESKSPSTRRWSQHVRTCTHKAARRFYVCPSHARPHADTHASACGCYARVSPGVCDTPAATGRREKRRERQRASAALVLYVPPAFSSASCRVPEACMSSPFCTATTPGLPACDAGTGCSVLSVLHRRCDRGQRAPCPGRRQAGPARTRRRASPAAAGVRGRAGAVWQPAHPPGRGRLSPPGGGGRGGVHLWQRP
jgi:hypothetical protein